jgi:hypothetical protein
MKNNLKIFIYSVCIALIICYAMVSEYRFISSPEDLSKYDQIVLALYVPAINAANLIMGEGSTLDRLWIIWVLSMIIYTLLTWFILSLLNWLFTRQNTFQTHQGHSLSKEKKAPR